MSPFHPRHLLACVLPCFLADAKAQNLLVNGSFTGSTASWTTSASQLVAYGTTGWPDAAVAARIGGGGTMLRDLGSGFAEQIVNLGSVPAGSSVLAEGYLGGGSQDNARLVVRFLDAGGGVLQFAATDWVTSSTRNFENVLMYRSLVASVPPGATRFAVRVEFQDVAFAGPLAAADEISARLIVGNNAAPAWPLGAELLANPGFEAGWNGASPLTLTDARGWEGAPGTGAAGAVRSYANNTAGVPSALMSCEIEGAWPRTCASGAVGNLLGHTGTVALRQVIDVRGNAAQFAAGAAAVDARAFLGGIGGEPDTAQVDLVCLGGTGNSLASLQLGPVSVAARNGESVLMPATRQLPVPAGTEWFVVTVTMTDTAFGGPLAYVDNLSVRLVPPALPAPVALNVDLVGDGDFEDGWNTGSPVRPSRPDTWFGGGGGTGTQVYGTAGAPSAAFAIANGLGANLAVDRGSGVLRRAIDLRGNAAAIATGNLAMAASAWLGGVGGEPDTAEVRIRFENGNGVAVGLPQQLGPVTAAERQNVTTLLRRTTGTFLVPRNSARAVVELVMTDTAFAGPRGLADDIRLVAFDPMQQASVSPWPGTVNGDLVLASGIDEEPRTGIGQTIKTASAGDVLRVRIGSPRGTLDGMPLILAANVYPAGVTPTPTPGFPGLALDLTKAAILMNGFGGGPFAPVVVPMAQGGNVWHLRVPAMLDGSNLLLQAVALSPTTTLVFTEGHEIR